MPIDRLMKQLSGFGSEQTKKTYINHGAKEPLFGVKVNDLQKIIKNNKISHNDAVELYETGNSDAMYLAGMVADPNCMTRELLEQWVDMAYWYYLSEYAVAFLLAKHRDGFAIAIDWIESSIEQKASCGWAALSKMSLEKKFSGDELLVLENLMKRIESSLHLELNRVKYTMNGFVIAVGANQQSLYEKAQIVARKIGKVNVDMGKTACKVPNALEYIEKLRDRLNKKTKREK